MHPTRAGLRAAWCALSMLWASSAARISDHRADGESGRSCPEGLGDEAGAAGAMCSYPDGSAPAAEDPTIFTNASRSRLLFNLSAHGAFPTNTQFVSELSAAFTDRAAMYAVGASLAKQEMERDPAFAKEVVAGIISHQAGHSSKLHELERDLKPGFFVVEHVLEHAFVEGLEIGFHALAHAADHGLVMGAPLLAQTFGIELAEVALAGSVLSGFVLHWVLPVLLPIQAGQVVWQMRSQFKKQTHHAKNFTAHLVLKGDCMEEKLRDVMSSLRLSPIVEEVCGADFQAALEVQIRAAIEAQIELYETLASFGRCVWPHGKRRWSKIACAEELYEKMFASHGQAGILHGALAFMAHYGFRLDELVDDPFLEKWYGLEFGILKESNTTSLLPKLAGVRGQKVGERWPVCMQLIATHRAFERTFQRMNLAIKVWLRSFARGFHSYSVRTSWVPCQKVFFAITDDSGEGFCKHFDWIEGHGRTERAIDEAHSCEQAMKFTGSLFDDAS